MNEQALRALIRQAIAHHVSAARSSAPGASTPSGSIAAAASRGTFGVQSAGQGAHASHALFMLPADPEGACVVEPAARCNHCGFCKSYGH